VKPQSGERTLNIIATTASVDLVTVTDNSGTVLYRGSVKAGESRSIPRTGALTISTDQPQNLSVQTEAGGPLYQLKDQTGAFLKRSTVKAP
jgi:hypothetical protein